MAEIITKTDVNVDDVVAPALKALDAAVKAVIKYSDAGALRLADFGKAALAAKLPDDVFVLEATRIADTIPAGAAINIQTDQLTEVQQLDSNNIKITASVGAGPIVLGGFVFENLRSGQARAANRLQVGIDISLGKAYLDTVAQRIDKGGMAQQLNALSDLMKQMRPTP